MNLFHIPKKKKIFVFVGHPDNESLNVRLADAYARGARDQGHEVKRVNIGDMHFDPILHKGYRAIQELEPDLKQFQEDMRWCDHFVIFYPSWWSTMPALLKGLFDRIWLPGFAFRFEHKGITHGYMWRGMLKGKTARVFVTSDSPAILARLLFGDSTNEIKRGILGFAGIRAKITKIGSLKNATPQDKENLVEKCRHYGKWAC